MKINFPVDAVCLWVNSQDENWQEKYFKTTKQSPEATRFSNNGELLFCLRSIFKNLSWIRKVFLVTDQQVPEWLLFDKSRIEIIDHREIIDKQYLPTFNSEVIESFIDNIPGLSEHFLYLNDDVFIWKELTKDFFFNDEGLPIVRLTGIKTTTEDKRLYYQSLRASLNTFNSFFSTDFQFQNCHTVDAFLKSEYKKCREVFRDKFSVASTFRTRKLNDVQRIIFSLYLVKKKKCILKVLGFNSTEAKYYSLNNLRFLKEKIEKDSPSTFCINDDEQTDEYSRENLPLFLSSLYPEKSCVENLKFDRIFPVSKNSKSIVFSFDEKYCKYFFSTINSLKKYWPSDVLCDIVILYSYLSEKSKKYLEASSCGNISIRFYNVTTYLIANSDSFRPKVRSYWSVETYYKCLIPIIFSGFDKVLFCDSDVCFNQDVSSIFDIELDENIQLIAVLDSASPLLDSNYQDRKQQLLELGIKDPQTHYFNAGVLLFNLNKIDANSYQEELFVSLEKKNLLFQDQDVLNIIFNQTTKIIGYRFNYQTGVFLFNPNYLAQLSESQRILWLTSKKLPIVVHFTGSLKPWNFIEQDFSELFWSNLRNTPFYEEILISNFTVAKQKGGNILEKIKSYRTYSILNSFSLLFFPLGSPQREKLKRFLKKI